MNAGVVALLALLLTVQAAVSAVAGPNAPQLPWGADPPAAPAFARAASIADLGRQMFADPRLSASGSMSCASCHDPANHFAPSNAASVQVGGARLDHRGVRAVPSLTYGASTPPFTEHFYESEDDGDESVDQGPAGGRTWDGRVNRASAQAAMPLLDSNEMANQSEAAVVARVAAAPFAPQMRRIYGDGIFSDSKRALAVIGEALEAYQQLPAEFSPYTSKFDAVLRGQADFKPQEARGLAEFNDPARGNCNHCHKSQVTPAGNLPIFTDAGFIAVGVPRNHEIPANADSNYFDLGACGPYRKDLADRPEFCGMFKAPSLRNVATRGSFYHNGIFHSLKQAVAFYATRDTNPEIWYPRGPAGRVQKFDDLPPQFQKNIDYEPPFGGHPGGRPALSPEDVDDIVAFLGTLTDGFVPPHRLAAAAQASDDPRSLAHSGAP